MVDETVPEYAVAIVGRAGRFPAARSVPEFWRMLAAGRNATTWLSDAELLAAGVPRRALADPHYVKAAHILPDMEGFDAGFWGFSPREAQILDPQHRHFLETSWEALEDAGHMPENFDGRVGVFAGSGMQAYMAFNLLSNPDLVAEIGLFLLRHTGNDKDFMPTRLSYLLNLTGPSIAVQTACSTSLVAVHMAANSLLNMECDMAIAGGVTIELPHGVGYRYEPGEILSPDGLCRAFDDASEGTVFGSGAAVVVLRRLSDALADGDDIKAVILGSAINNDGAGKASYLAPSVDGQAEAAAEAVALAGVEPASISYIEAHGTGTPIGDPIELSALTQVYGEASKGAIGIGSVKTNIGHLDTAAGAASLIKVVEALRHKTLPASLHFKTPNSRYDWETGPFRVVSDTQPWPSVGPRRAAVNSLGVGGTNAHVVVEEAPAPAARPTPEVPGWRLFPFSARTQGALDLTPAKWAEFLAAPEVPAPGDIGFTLREGRRLFPERMAVAADSLAGLGHGLSARVSAARRRGTASERPPRIVFLFPGGGAQYPGAGAEMMAAAPAFAEAIEACFKVLPDMAPSDLREMMFDRDLSDTEARNKLARSNYAIPALFILEYAYARLWDAWGVVPDAIFAHSVGEYAGAVVAGVMGLADALRVVTLRGRVMEDAPKGAMTTVPFCAPEAEAYLSESLDIAAINSAAATVVSGRLADIEAVEARLAEEGHEARRIHIDVAAHSRQLDGQLGRFRAGFEGVVFSQPKIPMVSSLRGGWGEGEDFASADYWVRHLRHTVRFTDAMEAALAEPDCVVIEVGPGQTLGPLVEAADLAHPPRAILPSGPRPRDPDHEMAVALAAAGGLWAGGWPLDFARLPGGATGRRVSMPTYAFEHTRHWIAPGRGSATEPEAAEALVLGRIKDQADWIEALGWEDAPALAPAAVAGTTWLVLAGEDPLSVAVCAGLAEGGAQVVTVRRGAGFASGPDGIVLDPDRPEDFEALLEALPDLPTHILSLWGIEEEAPFDTGYLLARALQLADAGAGRRLVFAVSGATPESRAKGAALLGLVRVAPREVPGLSAALVDLPADPELESELAPALITEVLSGDAGADHVALGPGKRQLRRRHAAPHSLVGGLPARLQQGGVYVLTGGSGGIGRQMARWLARTAGAKVALLSRHAQDDPGLAAEIAELGGALMSVAADVTDRASLAEALDAVRAHFGDITGVIHGAGRIDDRPLSSKSLEEAQAVLAPKLEGARHLDALLPEGSLDMFCVISSSSVVIGGAGQADYAGANAALEALADARADGFSIAWGVWRDIGMAACAYGAGEEVAAPLPGLRHEEAGGVIVFETRLDPDSDWRLTGHKVAGQPIFPGTAFVELAYAAGRTLWPDGAVDLSAVAFEEAMSFADGLPRRATLRLEPETVDGVAGYAVTILSRVGGEAPVRHVTARLAFGGPPELPAALADHALADPGPGTPVDGAHQAAQEELIVFGPRWNTLQGLTRADEVIEGRFALAPNFMTDLEAHPLHPALLDMAWTVGLYALPEAERADKVYVPMSVGRMWIDGPLPARVTARARRTGGEPGRIVSFAVTLDDEVGRSVAVIEDFALWAVPGGTLAANAEVPPLTMQLLATGIRKTEAADVFARVFDHPERALVVSPVSLDLVRLAMEEIPARAEVGTQGSGAEIADPVTAKLAAIWSEILGVSAIGLEDEFFALGGHSLNAVRMFGRVKRDMGVSLSIATLFEAPTLSALADRIAEAGGLVRAAPVEAAASEVAPTPELAPEPRRLPMTIGQREIASSLMIDPETARGYNLSFSLIVAAEIDTWILQKALRDLALRHDMLRATVDLAGLSLDIAGEVEIPFETVDLSHLPETERAAARDALVAERGGREIDLVQGPAVRALAIRIGPAQSEIGLFYHHILCDGWSTGVVLRDLAAFYAARKAGTAPRLDTLQPIDDLLAAEADWADSTEAEAHRAWWRDVFADGVPPMDLPLDRPRPAERTSEAGQVLLRIEPELERALRLRAKVAGVTLSHVVFAAYNLLLSRLIGAPQTVLGLPNAGQLVHGLDAVVTHSVNFLCPVFEARPETGLEAYLSDVYRRLVAASDHQGYAYADLVKDLQIPRDPARVPIVPVVVNIDNLAAEKITFEGQSTKIRVNPAGHEHFEIFFNIWDAEGRIELTWNYLTALFAQEAIALQADTLVQLLREISEAPGQVPLSALLSGRTDLPASGSFEDPGVAGPQDIIALFRDVAARAPGKTALRFGGAAMDYATLDGRSDALAGVLAARGIGPGDLVGVTSERRPELVVAVIGALKAGAGYVPFDIGLPDERLAFMADDTGIKVLLGRLAAVEAAGVPTLAHDDFPHQGMAPAVTNAPNAPSYVMFTSGTTGTPKAVVQTHRSVVRLLVDTDWVDLGPDTVTLHSSAFAFDTSIIDIFGALLQGGTVVIPPPGQLSIADLADAIESHGVNTLWLTSGLFHAVADTRPGAFARVGQVIVGGDVVSPVHVARVMAACPDVAVINGFGPTETHVVTSHRITAADLASGGAIPIGRAIPGTQIFITNATGWPVPPGIPGEMVVAGRALANGYWNRPELTAEKFIAAPWDPNLTLYRTGDLAMDPGDGVIQFLGRIDSQVKIRGYRVELGEVETVLESHPGVRQASVAALVPEGQMDKVLAAYVVADDPGLTAEALAAHARMRLPDFAQPASIMLMEALPLNPNGKVDRRRLPTPTFGTGAGRPPETAAERRLAEIWGEILGIADVDATTSFFALGGHSLLAVRLFDLIREAFGADLPISTLFRHQTVADLAVLLCDAGPVDLSAAAMSAPTAAIVSTDPDAPWDTTTFIHPGPVADAAQTLFIVGGVGGNVNNLFLLGQVLGQARAVVGFQTRGVMGHRPHGTIEEMAAENIRYMRAHQPEGPYMLAGYSGGALSAHEMVRQLEAAGETVTCLVVLDTFAPGFATDFIPNVKVGIWWRIKHELWQLRQEGLPLLTSRAKAKFRTKLARGPLKGLVKSFSLSHYRFEMMRAEWHAAAGAYRGGPIAAPVTLFKTPPVSPVKRLAFEADPSLGWEDVVPAGAFEIIMTGGDHRSMLTEPHVVGLAKCMATVLSRASGPSPHR